jgi:hypothetical protein
MSPISALLYPVEAGSNSGANLATINSGPAGTVLAIVGANADKFEISGNQLRSAAGVDLIEEEAYTCNVTSTANGATTTSSAFTLTIRTAAGPSGEVTLSQESLSVLRPTSGFVVLAHVTAVLNATLAVIRVSGAQASNYAVVGTQIRTGAIAPSAGTHTFFVRATEPGGATFDSPTFTLTMLAPPSVGLAPTSLTLNPLEAASNSGQSVATIFPSPAEATLALAGADADKFEISGTQLRTAAEEDLVAQEIYSCSVVASANGGTASSTFTLFVNAEPGPSGEVTLSASSYSGSPGVFYVSGAFMCHATAAAGSTLSIIVVSGEIGRAHV